jgi:hypothetical protein
MKESMGAQEQKNNSNRKEWQENFNYKAVRSVKGKDKDLRLKSMTPESTFGLRGQSASNNYADFLQWCE